MKRWWWLGVVAAGLALATGAAAQENVLVLYGSPDRDWVAAVAAKFEKDTGIKVQWIRASSNEMYARIEAEKANPKGDVWFGGTGDPHFDAAVKGLTEPYCTAHDVRASRMDARSDRRLPDHRALCRAAGLGRERRGCSRSSASRCPRPGMTWPSRTTRG